MPRIPTPAETMRLAIDRRVATARAVHVLGILGRIACAAAIAWSTMLLLQRFAVIARAPRTAIAVVAFTAAATAWPVVRRSFATWPTRLRIALAAEQSLPELGERISRAIEFLDELPPHGDRDGSPALKALAVDQAAPLAGRIPRAPLGGTARHLLLAAAGGVAIAGLAVGTWWTGTTSTTEQTTVAAQPRAEPVAAETLALWRQIEAARASVAFGAAFERRLAAVLTGWFVAGPGVPDVEVPPRRRGMLAQTADLQDDCLAAMITVRESLLAIAPPLAQSTLLPTSAEGIHEAARLLAAIDETARAESSAAIRDHRLAVATHAATRHADLLERAAAILGAAPAAPAIESQFTDDTPPQTLRLVSERLLDRLERIAAAAAPHAVAADGPEPFGQAATAKGLAAGPTAGDGTTAATTSPRFGTAAAPATAVELTGREADGGRLWTLLPEQTLPLRPGAADAAAFPSHREAIDAYYRLLFDLDLRRRTQRDSSQP